MSHPTGLIPNDFAPAGSAANTHTQSCGNDFTKIFLSVLTTVGLLLVVLSVTYAPLHLYLGSPSSLLLLPEGWLSSAVGILAIVLGYGGALVLKKTPLFLRLDLAVVSAGLLILTDLFFRPYTLFFRDHIQVIALGAFISSPLVVTLFRSRLSLLFHVILATTMAYSVWSFLEEANGQILFSDDHAAFLFRFMQLKEEFPFIPFYSPLWNAGYDAREFLPSGCLNFFLLFAPLIYLFDVPDIYTLLVGLLLFVALPLSGYLSATLLRFSPLTRAIAGLVVLVPNLFWYRWALVYGTVGFITSCIFLLPTYALWTIILDKKSRLGTTEILLTVVCTTLAIFWTPAALTLIPIAALGLFTLPTLLRRRGFLLILASLLVINTPWMTLFVHSSKVVSFVSTSKEKATRAHRPPPPVENEKRTSPVSTASALLSSQASAMNPLVLILGTLGIFCLWRGHDRVVFGSIAAWLLFLALVVGVLKPQLELNRMLVLLSLLLSLTAAGGVDGFLSDERASSFSRFTLVSGCLSFVALGFVALTDIIRNDSILKYYHAGPIVADLSEAISAYHKEGRVMFAGFSLHELSNGHLAPLSLMTGVPLIASSYQHNLWKYTDVIPSRYRRRGEEGVLEYLDLMNVTAVVTHDRHWTKWFSNRSELFDKVWKSETFSLFQRRDYSSDYFVQGSGKFINQTNSTVTLWTNDEEVIVKFTYFPFVRSSRCKVSPHKVSAKIVFTKLSNCPRNAEVTLYSANPLERLIGAFSDTTLQEGS